MGGRKHLQFTGNSSRRLEVGTTSKHLMMELQKYLGINPSSVVPNTDGSEQILKDGFEQVVPGFALDCLFFVVQTGFSSSSHKPVNSAPTCQQ